MTSARAGSPAHFQALIAGVTDLAVPNSVLDQRTSESPLLVGDSSDARGARTIRAKAPLRVSFAGGGTDVTPFPEREGGMVLNATIDRYAYGTLQERQDSAITVHSLDLNIARHFGADDELQLDGELDLVKAAVRRLAGGRPERGFDLVLRTSAPPGSGLGSSSSLMVCLVGVLSRFLDKDLDNHEMASLAWQIERQDLGLRGGLQDQYASVFGGFNFIEFEAERTIVNPLRIPEDVVDELEASLLLCFTGETRASDRVIQDQTTRYEARAPETLAGLRAQKKLVPEMKDALLRGHLVRFGELLGSAWEAKRRMSPHISNGFIDSVYEAAKRAGAIGGKVTGAGGGGFILFAAPFHRRHLVAEALAEIGIEDDGFAFDRRGMRTWMPSAH
jgi:D-glycero-alpha-D-manno-heptose-7-phosphate kinase